MNFSINARRIASRCRELAGITLFRDINLAAILLFLALLLPFVLRYHREPDPSFYQEWLAVFLSLAATILVAARHRGERFDLPFAACIPLALVPVTLVHLVAGNYMIVRGPLLYLTFVASAVLMMMLGRKLRMCSEGVSLADVMAAALVAGALASAVASWHWRFGTGVFATVTAGTAEGWLGQRNHNGLHIWLGILGICHFYLNRKLAWILFALGLGILVEHALQTGSRSVYLYAACGLALGMRAALKSPQRGGRRRMVLIGLLPVILLGVIQLALLHSARAPGEAALAIQRSEPAAVAKDPRPGLWLTASWIALEHPWIGAGPGSYVRESWILADRMPDDVPVTVPSTHAHNLFFQIAAELGIATAFALFGLICAWLVFALRQAYWEKTWLHVAIPIVILTHNQVEFSLWYLFFLVPAALSMGAAMEQTVGKGLPATAVLVVTLLGLGLAAKLNQDYQALEQVVTQSRADRADVEMLLAAADHPIFGPWASTEIARQPASAGIPRQQLDLHAMRALYAIPLAKAAVVRHAEMLEQSGKSSEAAAERRITRRVFAR